MNRYGYDGQLGCAAITFPSRNSAVDTDTLEKETISKLESWLSRPSSALPAYAIPRFLRILDSGEPSSLHLDPDRAVGESEQVSAVMKKIKVGLRNEGTYRSIPLRRQSHANEAFVNFLGFSLPLKSKDKIYWIEKEGSGYVPLTKAAEQTLLSGHARL